MSGAELDQDRWSSPQGNVTGLGIVASYSVRFWTLVIGLGVITGLAAARLIALLRLVERVSYGIHRPTLLAAAMQAPLAGTVLVLEMTNHFQSLVLPTLVAVIEATVLSRKLGAASIYSARLRRGGVLRTSPPADVASAAAIGALDEDPRADQDPRCGEDPRAEAD